MASLLLLLLGIATLFVAGYGPTLWLVDRGLNVPRGAAMPVIGLGCYLTFSHWLAWLGLNGRWISWLCLVFFLLAAAAVPRGRRLTREEVRASLAPLAIACAGLLLAAWPLLYAGYDCYLAFGNPDAAFNLAAYQDMIGYRYGQADPNATAFWPRAQLAHVFGAGYLGILVSLISGADIVKLHEVIAGSVLFAAPISVFLLCLLNLNVSRRVALATAGVFAASSLLLYTFYLQSLGALTLMSLAPATLALWAAALRTSDSKLALASGLLIAGACFGYYASFPILGLLLATQAAVALLRREVRAGALVRAVLISALILAVSHPALTLAIVRRAVAEAASTRLVASLHGQEVLLSFAFALTEQLAGFFWGVLIPPLAGQTSFAPPGLAFLAALAVGTAASAALILILVKPGAWPPAAVRVQVLSLLAVVAYYLARDNAYGVFKLAAWANPVLFPCLVSGLWLAGKGWRWPGIAPRILLAAVVALNLFWCVRLGVNSLPSGGRLVKSLSGMTARQLHALREMLRVVEPGARILMAVPDPVVQRWALTYIRHRPVSVVPYLSLSPDRADALEKTAAEDAAAARYLLTWSDKSQDIAVVPRVRPVRQSEAFQLLSLAEVTNFPVLGRGWYRLEQGPVGPAGRVTAFRWLRSDGEVILLRPGKQDLRLSLTLAPGYGRKEPQREIKLLVDGKEFDQIVISGFAHVVSRPFRSAGFLSRIRISLPDNAEPLPNPWGLLNRWVPRDPRRLNIAVSRIEVLTDRAQPAPTGSGSWPP